MDRYMEVYGGKKGRGEILLIVFKLNFIKLNYNFKLN